MIQHQRLSPSLLINASSLLLSSSSSFIVFLLFLGFPVIIKIMERTVVPLPGAVWALRSLLFGEDKGFAADRRFNAHCLQVPHPLTKTVITHTHHHHHPPPSSHTPSHDTFLLHCMQVIKEKKESIELIFAQKLISEAESTTAGDDTIPLNPERPCLIDSLLRATSDKDTTFLTGGPPSFYDSYVPS